MSDSSEYDSVLCFWFHDLGKIKLVSDLNLTITLHASTAEVKQYNWFVQASTYLRAGVGLGDSSPIVALDELTLSTWLLLRNEGSSALHCGFVKNAGRVLHRLLCSIVGSTQAH